VISVEAGRRPADADLRALWLAVWSDRGPADFTAILSRSLGHVGAYDGARLVGFLNVAWDGGVHASVFDVAVHPDYRRRGIGTRLVKAGIDLAGQRGAGWLHVDFKPHLSEFYWACGFRPTAAGVIKFR
jgi:ribosomal protein S18 acetylase RimI-like enzyme